MSDIYIEGSSSHRRDEHHRMARCARPPILASFNLNHPQGTTESVMKRYLPFWVLKMYIITHTPSFLDNEMHSMLSMNECVSLEWHEQYAMFWLFGGKKNAILLYKDTCFKMTIYTTKYPTQHILFLVCLLLRICPFSFIPVSI